jgi:hypothetical protein
LQLVGSGTSTCATVLSQRLAGALRSAEGLRYLQTGYLGELAMCEFSAGQTQAPELTLPLYLCDKVAMTLVKQGKA